MLSWERSLDEALTSGGREMRFGNNNFQHLLFQSRVLCYTHARSLSLSLSLSRTCTYAHTNSRAQHSLTHTSRASWLGDASALMLMRQKLFLALGEKFKLFSVSDDCKVSFDLFSHLSHFHFSLNDLFFV